MGTINRATTPFLLILVERSCPAKGSDSYGKSTAGER